jgi:hypothetical protein
MEEQPLIPFSEQEPPEYITDNPELIGDLLVRHSVERPVSAKSDQPELALSPEAVERRITEAAKHDEPIERQLELRHEVKDQATQQDNPLFAVPVSKMPTAAATRPQPDAPQLSPPPSPSKSFASTRWLGDYHQPIRLGFYLGLGLVLSLILFLVLQ